MITLSENLLRKVLLVDAATCVAAGILMSFGAGLLAGLLVLPSALLFAAGLALFPVAAFMAVVALRANLAPGAVWLVVIGNALWIAGSIWLMTSEQWSPNALGLGFIAAQAAAVAVLTFLEYLGVVELGVPAAT